MSDALAGLEVGEESQLALEILAYFRRHPDAKDSVEGIARFWVGADGIEVRRALDRLIALGLVVKRASSSLDLYGLAAPSAVREESA